MGTSTKTVKQHLASKKFIKENQKAFKANLLSPEKKKKYLEKIFTTTPLLSSLDAFLVEYKKYLEPNHPESSLSSQQILAAIQNPHNYILQSKSHYKQTIDKKTASLLKQEKQNLIEALLPFTTDESEYEEEQIGLFERQDYQRIKLYTQMQKGLELDERELFAKYKDMEQKARDQFLEAKEEKIAAKHEKLDVKYEQLKAKETILENSKILLQIEGYKQELDYKIKFIELANISLEQQQKQNNFQLQEKELEVMELLFDYEMKNREINLTHGQQLLELNQRGLENELKLQEAEYLNKLSQQENLRINIENKLLNLRNGEFQQKAEDTFLEIKRQRIALQQDKYKLDNKIDLQKAQIMKERAYMDKQVAKLSEEKENMYQRMEKLRLEKSDMEQEKNWAIAEMRMSRYFR